VAQTNIVCGEAEFEVQDFSVYLGESCRDDDEQKATTMQLQKIQETIAGNILDPGDVVCILTSDALNASRGFIAVVIMVFALFCHLGL